MTKLRPYGEAEARALEGGQGAGAEAGLQQGAARQGFQRIRLFHSGSLAARGGSRQKSLPAGTSILLQVCGNFGQPAPDREHLFDPFYSGRQAGRGAAAVTLASAVDKAKSFSVPNENIERAIKRGTGEGKDGEQLDEITYEGYAPGGVAIMVETATDNRNRTGAEVRRIFTQNNGNLASTGSVSYMFHRKGQITVPRLSIDEDQLLEIALEAGAEELTTEEDQYVITTSHDQLYAVAEALKKAGVSTDGQRFTFIPDTTVAVRDETVARQVLRLCDALEEDDDVQNVYSNLDIPDELLAKLPA